MSGPQRTQEERCLGCHRAAGPNGYCERCEGGTTDSEEEARAEDAEELRLERLREEGRGES